MKIPKKLKLLSEEKHMKNLIKVREYLKSELDTLLNYIESDCGCIEPNSTEWMTIESLLDRLERIENYMVKTQFIRD